MTPILILLRQLDTLYYADLAAYEQQWQEVAGQVETLFPGFTLAHGEVYTQGREREASGRMRHVLLPTERSQQS